MLSRRGMHSRREFLQAGAVAMTGAEFGFGRAAASGMFQSGGRPSSPVASVKALVFDTFGTVVDWRTSVTQEVEQLARKKGLTVDGAKFADAWRAGYRPSMDRVRTGELPWTKLDRLHRMTLDRILIDFGIKGLSETETDALNRAWHRLRPWPDASGWTHTAEEEIHHRPSLERQHLADDEHGETLGITVGLHSGRRACPSLQARSRGLPVRRRHS